MLSSLHFKYLFHIHCPLIFSILFLSAVVSRIWQLGAFLLDLHQLHPIINYRGKMIGWFLCICTATGVCYYQPNVFIFNTRPVLSECKAPSWEAAAVVTSEWLTRGWFLVSHTPGIEPTPLPGCLEHNLRVGQPQALGASASGNQYTHLVAFHMKNKSFFFLSPSLHSLVSKWNKCWLLKYHRHLI